MEEKQPADGLNLYESPREHGYVSPEYLAQRAAWLAWLKDRILLWGCGWTVFFTLWATLMMGVAIAWLLGFEI